jgi:hypothetical protein
MDTFKEKNNQRKDGNFSVKKLGKKQGKLFYYTTMKAKRQINRRSGQDL